MVLWVLNLSRIILSKRGLCVVMFFAGCVEHWALSGCCRLGWLRSLGAGSGSLTGSPGDPGTEELGWELHMLLGKAVWRRRVLGQRGVSREMMRKNLPWFPACSQGLQLPCAGMDFPPPHTPMAQGLLGSFPGFSWKLRELKSISAGKENWQF